MLTKYFQNKMKIENGNNFELFDKVIGAFKINNIPIEIHRTTHQKTYSDLIQCTMLPKNTEFCFIDDTEYAKMKHDKIYYIKPREYIHSLTKNEIIERLHLKLPDLGVEITPEYWYYWLSQSTSTEKNKESLIQTNIEVSKKIMFHIREFFILSSFQKYRNKSRKKLCDNKNTGFSRNTKKNKRI
jgi:hypothetical protein